MTCYWWLTSSLIIHCSPADVQAPSKNLANWWSIISVTNSADIRVYSYGLCDGGVDDVCWLHLKLSTPSRFVMCTKHDHSTLMVFVDCPWRLCFTGSLFQHYTLPLMINPPKWFIFSSWHLSSICHACLYLSKPPLVVPIICQVPEFSCDVQFNRSLVALLLWWECTRSGNYIYSLPTTYIIYFV